MDDDLESTPRAVVLGTGSIGTRHRGLLEGLGLEVGSVSRRAGVSEFRSVDEAVREAVMNKRPTREIQESAVQNGMQTLWDGGQRRVIAGETTIEEVLMKVAAEML